MCLFARPSFSSCVHSAVSSSNAPIGQVPTRSDHVYATPQSTGATMAPTKEYLDGQVSACWDWEDKSKTLSISCWHELKCRKHLSKYILGVH